MYFLQCLHRPPTFLQAPTRVLFPDTFLKRYTEIIALSPHLGHIHRLGDSPTGIPRWTQHTTMPRSHVLRMLFFFFPDHATRLVRCFSSPTWDGTQALSSKSARVLTTEPPENSLGCISKASVVHCMVGPLKRYVHDPKSVKAAFLIWEEKAL